MLNLQPILVYASVVWYPYTKSNIDKIEMVQRKAVRFDFYRYSNVSNLFNQLNWESLELKRTKSTITVLYNILIIHQKFIEFKKK